MRPIRASHDKSSPFSLEMNFCKKFLFSNSTAKIRRKCWSVKKLGRYRELSPEKAIFNGFSVFAKIIDFLANFQAENRRIFFLKSGKVSIFVKNKEMPNNALVEVEVSPFEVRRVKNSSQFFLKTLVDFIKSVLSGTVSQAHFCLMFCSLRRSPVQSALRHLVPFSEKTNQRFSNVS